MINRPIDYVFLEGPDLSGKTTFYENLHKETDYCWNIQDRSALSMVIHSKFYNRDSFSHVEQLRRELYNLNNIMIILLPEWDEIARRFNLRGDPIQNITSLKKLYDLFSEAASEFESYPNVCVVRGNADDRAVKNIARSLKKYERACTMDIQQNCMMMCEAKESNEVVGLNFSIYDDGSFEDVDLADLLYDKEVDYYDEILSDIKQKIQDEIDGKNEYNRKESFNSRRFIYTSDTCISLAHFLLREDALDCKFFLRSSNVKDTLYFDINFLKHMTSEVYKILKIESKFCRMNFVINSGHIILGES